MALGAARPCPVIKDYEVLRGAEQVPARSEPRLAATNDNPVLFDSGHNRVACGAVAIADRSVARSMATPDSLRSE